MGVVAPADVDRATCVPSLRAFGPVPRERLPFRSLVVTADDDPHVAVERAERFATWWGSDVRVIHAGGHLNADSGLGRWPDGRALLARLTHGRGGGDHDGPRVPTAA